MYVHNHSLQWLKPTPAAFSLCQWLLRRCLGRRPPSPAKTTTTSTPSTPPSSSTPKPITIPFNLPKSIFFFPKFLLLNLNLLHQPPTSPPSVHFPNFIISTLKIHLLHHLLQLLLPPNQPPITTHKHHLYQNSTFKQHHHHHHNPLLLLHLPLPPISSPPPLIPHLHS